MEETLNNLQLIDDTFFQGTWSGIFYTTLDKLDIVLSSVKTEPNVNITAAYPQPANDILRIEFDNSILLKFASFNFPSCFSVFSKFSDIG